MRSIKNLFVVTLFWAGLTSCATPTTHRFAEPRNDWQIRTGQLMYQSRKTRLIGDVVIRSSKSGDFELTFSKGPGLPLLVLRQDAQFAQIKGALARNGWAGPTDRAPLQLRGWLQLRERLGQARGQKTIHYSNDGESFRAVLN